MLSHPCCAALALTALDARGYKGQRSRRGLIYKMQGITEVLLHGTAMATATAAEGLGFGLFFLAFPFLAIGHLGETCQWIAIPDRFLQSHSTFYEAPLTPAVGTFLGMVGCSLEQEQPWARWMCRLCQRDLR